MTKPSASYRILHTADWHLGKTLEGQSREDEHARFLAWLLERVGELEVDAVIDPAETRAVVLRALASARST